MNDETNDGAKIMSLSGGLELAMRGCRFGGNWLEVDESICDGDLQGVLCVFRKTDEALMWWLGDFLGAVERLRGRERMNAMAETLGASQRNAYRAASVCSLVPREKRVAGASLWLHAVALDEVISGVDDALEWVQRAMDDGMTVAQMRSEIRGSIKAANKEAAKALSTQRYAPLYQALAAVKKISVAELPEVDRETLLADTDGLWKWLCDLHGVDADGRGSSLSGHVAG